MNPKMLRKFPKETTTESKDKTRESKQNKNKNTKTYGGVAQLGEHLPCKQGVRSSNLLISTKPEAKTGRTQKTKYSVII